MLDNYSESIKKAVGRRDYKPVKLSKLAKNLGVEQKDYAQFKEAFRQLRQNGQIAITGGNLVTPALASSLVTGTFRANPKGFGFVVPLEPASHADIFIPPDETKNAMNGDIVSACITRKTHREGLERLSGKVVEILERSQNRFVGTLIKQSRGWFVQPDGSGFTDLIGVDDITAKNVKEKDKVVVEIITYPQVNSLARGVIIEVLGKAGRYESELNSVVRQFHIPDIFDDSCLSQAHNAASGFNPDSDDKRLNLEDKIIITIDPPDAKDFDDAISIEKDSNGNWVLGVHIADVSHFIKADSPLDKEAYTRGNSVYLPQKTIPMLPEVLSNGVCSLQPNQKRFCKSVFITYDSQADIINRDYANTVICSASRLTYQQAEQILKGRTKDFSPEVIKLIKDMEKLSRIIEARRIKAGMLHLALPETELVFDSSERVVDAHPADDSYPHTIIEMFMVEANEAVASLADKLNIPFLRRIHPDPDNMSMKELTQLVRTLGISFPQNPNRFDIQNLLDAVKTKNCEFAVNMYVLRSLEKAVYSPVSIGHYALASRHYSHFTSPIRRYADLLLHRILDGHLRSSMPEQSGQKDLAQVGKHITFTEERAEDAEEELKTVLILQMLKKRLGDEIDCVVTGLAKFGVFARCLKFGIEGLIPLEELGPDNWQFHQKSYCITGVKSGYAVHIGDKIKARIVSINIPARQLNLALAEPLARKSAKNKKSKPNKKQVRKNRRNRHRR
ncbi:MAG: ribonuclease R [Phycisphaerae bacterium]